MTALFRAYLVTTLLGAVLTLVLLSVKPLTKKIFSAGWHYYIWLAVLVVMMVPVQFHMPFLAEENALTASYDWVGEKLDSVGDVFLEGEASEPAGGYVDEKGRYIVSSGLQRQRELKTYRYQLPGKLARIWWSVAVVLFLGRALNYFIFLGRVMFDTKKVDCPEVKNYTWRKVFVRRAEWVASPMLMGVLCPILILPGWQLSERELHNVLSHEMVHLRRNDMLIKWFMVIVKCLHWFNPFVYVIGAQMNLACEISCDMKVTASMDKTQQMSYVDTILKLVANHRTREYALTMGMSGNKNQLKVRFQSMKKRPRVGMAKRVLSCSLAVLLLAVAFVCSGELAAKAAEERNHSAGYFAAECERCGETTLYLQRDMVKSVSGCSKFQYFVYTYFCDGCEKSWSAREAVKSDIVVRYQAGSRYGIMMNVENYPGVVDAEAEYALEQAGIDLYRDADSVEEALELIKKAIEKAR